MRLQCKISGHLLARLAQPLDNVLAHLSSWCSPLVHVETGWCEATVALSAPGGHAPKFGRRIFHKTLCQLNGGSLLRSLSFSLTRSTRLCSPADVQSKELSVGIRIYRIRRWDC